MKFFVIDGVSLGEKLGLGPRINVIMQTAFFNLGLLYQDYKSGAIPDLQKAKGYFSDFLSP